MAQSFNILFFYVQVFSIYFFLQKFENKHFFFKNNLGPPPPRNQMVRPLPVLDFKARTQNAKSQLSQILKQPMNGQKQAEIMVMPSRTTQTYHSDTLCHSLHHHIILDAFISAIKCVQFLMRS